MAKRRKDSPSEAVHKALTHPLRTDILLRMEELGRLSPVTYSKVSGETINLSAYHFNTLAKHGAIELVDTKPRRGATEHIYALNPESQVVKVLLASRMSEGQSRDASEEFLRRVLAEETDSSAAVNITPVLVDGEGRREVEKLLADTSKRLRDAEAASRKRLGSSPEAGTSLHVAMAAFRWEPPER